MLADYSWIHSATRQRDFVLTYTFSQSTENLPTGRLFTLVDVLTTVRVSTLWYVMYSRYYSTVYLRRRMRRQLRLP